MTSLSYREESGSKLKKQDIMSNFIADEFQEFQYIQKNYTPDQIFYITELDLSNQKAPRMPNINYTLKTFFNQLMVLNLSQNKIRHIHANNLIEACPNLETFLINHNSVTELDEFLPLGKLKKLEVLDFSNNPMQILQKPFLILQYLLLNGCIDQFQKNKLHILSMNNINTMEYTFTEKDFRGLQKDKPATVPRRKGNFRRLKSLNGKNITRLDMFNTLYYEFFPEEKDETRALHQKNKSSITSNKPPKPQSNQPNTKANGRLINQSRSQNKTNQNSISPSPSHIRSFSTFEAVSSLYPRLKKQARKNKESSEKLEYQKQQMMRTFYSKLQDTNINEFKSLKQQMSGSTLKIKDALVQAKQFQKDFMGQSDSDEQNRKKKIPTLEYLNFQQNVVIRADDLRNEQIGMNDKVIYNKNLIKNISQSESRVIKRKLLYRKQMKKHDKVMNKIKYEQNGKFELSDDSSDMDEFFTKDDFKMHFKDDQQNGGKQASALQRDEEEEQEEVEYFRKKQKKIGGSIDQTQMQLDQFKSLQRLVKLSMINNNSKGQNIFIENLNSRLVDEMKAGKIDNLYNQQMIQHMMKLEDNTSDDSSASSVVSEPPNMDDFHTPNREPTTAASTMASGWSKPSHNKTQSLHQNPTPQLTVPNDRVSSVERKSRLQFLLAQGFQNKMSQNGYKLKIPMKSIKFYNKGEREEIIEENKQKFEKNVDIIQKLSKDNRSSKEIIRRFMNKELFVNEIIQPDIKMKIVNDKLLGIRPQVIRDAIEVAEKEEALLNKIRDIDPDILSDDCQPLNVEDIRNVYYQVIQNQYDQKDIKKLRSVLKKLYPKTKKLLSERKVREILKTDAMNIPQERLEFLQKYLSLTTQLQLFPTQNETKEEWSNKLMLKNEWENRRQRQRKDCGQLILTKDQLNKANAKNTQKIQEIIVRGNNNIKKNFGNNRENLSKTMEQIKFQKNKVLSAEQTKKKTNDIMTLMPKNNSQAIKKSIPKTAFKRWNEVFNKHNQLQDTRQSQLQVIDDQQSKEISRKLSESQDSLKYDEDYQANKMRIKSQRNLCSIVAKSMKIHNQL